GGGGPDRGVRHARRTARLGGPVRRPVGRGHRGFGRGRPGRLSSEVVTDSTSAVPGAATSEPADDTPEQLRIRRDQRQRLLDSGEETDVEVSVAGRVLFVRNTGKLCFVRLQDGVDPAADLSVPAAEGEPSAFAPQLQAMLSLANVGQERLDAWKQDVDLGDHVSVTGRVVRS